MASIYTDQEIKRLILEPKPLPPNFHSLVRLRPKRGHKEWDLDIKGRHGSQFRLILRQSNYNPFDFSVILAYCPPNSNQDFRLRRYNSKHQHTNKIEGVTFDDFHIHEATERYQMLGAEEDSYAMATDRFSDLDGALRCMLEDCGFEIRRAIGDLFSKRE